MRIKRLTIVAFFTIINLSVFCQFIDFFGDLPEFPGGDEALYKFIAEKKTYPPNWRKDSISGKVFLKFLIDSCGQIHNPEVIRGLNPVLDSIAINIIREMPNWNSAKQNGKPVSLEFVLPIRFGKPPEYKNVKYQKD